MKRIPVILCILTLAFAQTPMDTARKAQNTLNSLKTLEADFINMHFSSSVSHPLRETGKVWLKYPDMMKWHYTNLEEKIFLVEKGRYQMFVPEDNQLYRGSIDSEGRQGEVLKILTGRLDIGEGYTVEQGLLLEEKNSVIQIKLVPKSDDDYSFLLLDIDKKTWLIHKIVFFDWTGSRQEIIFENIRTNIRIPDSLFQLEVPPDVEIIDY